MVLSDPTIDPVTGLPVLDTSGIVQQIPLGRQTVDYAGWNATAQPTRTPLYPDDVIPVFANVQGQHPQTGNAQNVTTDGEGRLNVHTFPSGGGGGASPGTVFTQNLAGDLVASGHQFQGGLLIPLSAIVYTVELSFQALAGETIDGTSFSFCTASGQGDQSGNDAVLCRVVPGQNGCTLTAIPQAQRGVVQFPTGITLQPFMKNIDTGWFLTLLVFGISHAYVNCSITIGT